MQKSKRFGIIIASIIAPPLAGVVCGVLMYLLSFSIPELVQMAIYVTSGFVFLVYGFGKYAWLFAVPYYFVMFWFTVYILMIVGPILIPGRYI